MIFYMIKEYGIELIGGHIVRGIDENGVETEDRNWRSATLEADYVVDAFGMRKNQETADRFFELIPDVYYVGDCAEVKNILYANLSAYDRCCNI
jgi:NADH dehydrogenase FAD-containing subunit